MTCSCGLHGTDFYHDAWHRIVTHNDEVFAHHRKKREEKFDASLRKRQATAEKVAARRMRMVRAQEGDLA